MFGIFRGISKLLCIYSTIPRGNPKFVIRKPGWETLTYGYELVSSKKTIQ